ncbi:hypothetical protein BW897_09605 [Bacillus cereus]|uniref:Spore protein YkvP/CgeB glycosyl transferase-like domain-containing protein n=1 Tax=Bacillus cereus TaxID=1396 RepID=A0A1S9TT48_BACCE|nr:hypothetical protein BW897_09605 [Bacillus cereus]
MPFYNINILYVRSGLEDIAAYNLISMGITNCLRELIKEVHVVDPSDDVLGVALGICPDFVLVLLGDRFSLKKVQKIREAGIKIAVWLTDDPYYVDETIKYAPYYDFIFTNELSTISVYQTFGCKQVYYLPMAANNEVFFPKVVKESYRTDICFIAAGWENRISFFDDISDFLLNKEIKIIGPLWNNLSNYSALEHKIYAHGIQMIETAKYLCGAKIVINLHRSHNDQTLFSKNTREIKAHSVNPRTFEISACGSFQLTDVRSDLKNFYTPGYDIETFASKKEFMRKIQYYLQHEEKRNEIASRGFKQTIQKHTYHNRLSKLIECILSNEA